MNQIFIYLLMLFAVVALPAQAARVALVIGNAGYAERPLKNPVNDAQDLAKALEGADFKVILKKNINADGMKEAISEFGDMLRREKGVGLFYFSGHGVQTPRGNFLLPVGRTFKREKDVELFAVEARSVLDEMEHAGNPLNILILDACRDSPLPSVDKSVGSKGLARMDAPSGSVIAFATAPGKTASDNSAGRNGLYTKHLISAINTTPGLRLEDVFRRVGAEVEKESAEQGFNQSPEEVMKLRSEHPFYFRPPSIVPERVPPAHATPNKMEDTEQKMWDFVVKSNKISDYQTYLKSYPKSTYSELARDRILKLSTDEELTLWSKVDMNNIAMLNEYTERYPVGKYYKTAKDRIQFLNFHKNIENETKEWGLANSKLLVISYISRYPNGKYISEAKKRLAEFESIELENQRLKPTTSPSIKQDKNIIVIPSIM